MVTFPSDKLFLLPLLLFQGYLAPSKIDPKLLSPKHVFQEVEGEGKGEEPKINLTKLQVCEGGKERGKNGGREEGNEGGKGRGREGGGEGSSKRAILLN